MQLRGVYLRAGNSSSATKINGVTVGVTAYTHVDMSIGGITPGQAIRIREGLLASRPKVNLAVGWPLTGSPPYYSPLQQLLLLSCLDLDVVNGLVRRGALRDHELLYRHGMRTLGELKQAYGQS